MAHEENCIFVNFNLKEKNFYGRNELLKKLISVLKETNLYKTYNKKYNFLDEEFDELINKEAEIRKIRAKKIIKKNSMGPGVKGVKKWINLAVPKYAIKKDANILGFEVINILPKKDDNEIMDIISKQKFFEIEECQSLYYYSEKELITNNNKKIYIRYPFIYKGSGITTGYYFPFELCEILINELHEYFKENVAVLSGSILKAAEYLDWKIKNI